MTFGRIGTFEVAQGPLGPVVDLFRDRVTPMFGRHDGFLGYQAFVDEAAGRYVGISYWTSLAALEASAETARQAREEAAALGARTVGEPMILRQAFDTRAAGA
jgi:quinol monooxygenase YgiN